MIRLWVDAADGAAASHREGETEASPHEAEAAEGFHLPRLEGYIAWLEW